MYFTVSVQKERNGGLVAAARALCVGLACCHLVGKQLWAFTWSTAGVEVGSVMGCGKVAIASQQYCRTEMRSECLFAGLRIWGVGPHDELNTALSAVLGRCARRVPEFGSLRSCSIIVRMGVQRKEAR